MCDIPLPRTDWTKDVSLTNKCSWYVIVTNVHWAKCTPHDSHESLSVKWRDLHPKSMIGTLNGTDIQFISRLAYGIASHAGGHAIPSNPLQFLSIPLLRIHVLHL